MYILDSYLKTIGVSCCGHFNCEFVEPTKSTMSNQKHLCQTKKTQYIPQSSSRVPNVAAFA